MPKKKVKGKSKGKGKGKGKSKKKEEKRLDKDEVVKEALANAKLWEVRFAAADKSRQEYRENVRKLVAENEHLQTNVIQTERDTIEVIAFLKKEDKEKDSELGGLRQDLKELHQETHKDREMLAQKCVEKVKAVDEQLKEKTQEVLLMQNELKTLQEFRRKKGEMQSEIDQLEKTLGDTRYQHKVELGDLEQKFFEEKMRLQREANKRVADLAEKAHQEAISNLDARTREVYKQNLQMAEALEIYKREGESLKKERERLDMGYRQLVAEKEVSQQLVQHKVQEGKQQRRAVQELQEKVAGLEEYLNTVIKEFEVERTLLQERHKTELEKNSAELVSLRRKCELQDREMNHIKSLAKYLLDQRTELEEFFMSALVQVKKEITTNRDQYRHTAQAAYQQRMLDATVGKAEFPHIKTFRPVLTSTSSVYHDMAEAESWEGVKDGADISDLTWEQKEQVLRLMFSKMNRRAQCVSQPVRLASPASRSHGASNDAPALPDKTSTFLTER